MRIVALAVALLWATTTLASSPDAWKAERRAARAACIAASGLSQPTITSPAPFDDRQPLDALLLTGGTRVARSRYARVTMICLYDRRAHRARAVEATGWPAVR